MSREERIRDFRAKAQPILDELQAHGFEGADLDALRSLSGDHRKLVPVLIKWLRASDDFQIKECIVRALSMPWAEEAASALVHEFKRLPSFTLRSSVRWTIGNALACIADDRIFDDLVAIVRNRNFGKDREMVVMAIGRIKNPAAVDVLIELLDDSIVAAHALEALRMQRERAHKALPRVLQCTEHPDARIRSEAKRTAKTLGH